MQKALQNCRVFQHRVVVACWLLAGGALYAGQTTWATSWCLWLSHSSVVSTASFPTTTHCSSYPSLLRGRGQTVPTWKASTDKRGTSTARKYPTESSRMCTKQWQWHSYLKELRRVSLTACTLRCHNVVVSFKWSNFHDISGMVLCFSS